MSSRRKVIVVCAMGVAAVSAARGATLLYGFGRVATPSEIRDLDISVFADGTGLPPGSGTARAGSDIYGRKCLRCHGPDGRGSADFPALVGGVGSLRTPTPVLTVGSYWPYATTIWDYVRRAMPYDRPGTLTADEVYGLTAYLLAKNGIIADTATLDRRTLPRVEMPNRDGFSPIPDDHPRSRRLPDAAHR